MQKFSFVFPGQGSQKLGMLGELADHFPSVLQTFREASDVLGFDLWEICQRDPENNLDRTEVTQPVLLTASIAIWRLWQELGGAAPAVLAGHSLGEYSALICGGVIEFSDGVNLVHKRGRYMQEAVPNGIGSMAAVVGLDDYRIHEICAEVAEGQIVSAANYNAPGQTVIAGNREAVDRAMAACKIAGAKRAILLNVSVPSHCALMKGAASMLEAELERIAFKPAETPIIQNVDAQLSSDPFAIKKNLIEQLYNPVRWVESIQLMHQVGIRKVIECGPGKVLCGLIKRINSDMASFGTEDSQSFAQAKSEVSL